MDAQDQRRVHPSISATKPRWLRRSVFLMSAAAIGFTTLGAGSVFHREGDAALKPGNALASVPLTNDGGAAPIRLASITPAEATTADADGGRLQDRLQEGLKVAADRIAGALSAAPAGRQFGIGDKLKITVYERVDSEDDKWGRAGSAMRGIQQRPELSGEYAVQEDGTISVPLLGTAAADGKSEQQVQAALSEAFQKVVGRKGIVNVMLMERPPVYVLGPVKTPGSFKYVSGMTVLHAIALAGGIDRNQGSDPFQRIEAVRTLQKRNAAVDSMLKLLARQAVLRAERDGTVPKIPQRLLKLVGAAEAASLVDEQLDRRKAVAAMRAERERAAQSAVDSAKQDLRMYARTDSLDELVKTRQERVDSMKSLVDKNIVAKQVLAGAQAELSDAEQRRQDAFNQYSQSKQRLAQLENDALGARVTLINDLQSEIELADRQIQDNEQELDASAAVLSSLPATRARFTDTGAAKPVSDQVRYLIVRQTAKGPVQIESNGMTVLRPGDLVDIAMDTGTGDAAPGGLAAPPSDTTPLPTLQRGPIERASRQETGTASKED